jgi:hypothetical protein
MATLPVNRILWESLESVLLAQSKELMRDIAKTLKQPEKPLMDAFKKEIKNVFLVDLSDPTDEKFLCEALLDDTEVAQRCRKAVVYGEKFCPLHTHWCAPSTLTRIPSLRRIKTSDGDVYFLCELTQTVYSQSYERVGFFSKNQINLFEITDV